LWEIEHRGVRLGVFHPGVGAPLAGREWAHRGWMTAESARRQLFASAADAAVALTR
jgi:hypothetical protein